MPRSHDDTTIVPVDADRTAVLPGGTSVASSIPAQLVRFSAVGVATWGAGTALYLLLRLGLSPFPANLVSTVAGTALSTAVHARFTFGASATHRGRARLQGLVMIALSLSSGNAVLAVLGLLAPDANTVAEAAALTATGALIALARFLVLRQWVFRGPDATHA
jgi:putative flippase GtrA